MTELTRQCLNLSKANKERLIKVLTESLANDEREDDGSRFSLLYKAATDVCGQGILTSRRDLNLVMGRRMIAYKMRQEGYSFMTIGKHMIRHHTSIIHSVRMMEDALHMQFSYECALWYLFNQRVNEYEYEKEVQS
jgi:chromosomal replication initiation ATPase DnaA